MSLRGLLKFGRGLLKGKKESATPTTGQQTKLLSYEGKGSQATGKELAIQEIRNPPVVLNQTKPLQMGDDVAPAFGSSTYDWVMRKGRGQYTADEWLDHLVSRRKVNFKIFGKPSTKTVIDNKKFKYDRGPFAGKEVNISREELFDSNLAIFNDRGQLTGGLLHAAQKFGMKLNANDVGAMIKLNPVNRLKTMQFGVPENLTENLIKNGESHKKIILDLIKKYRPVAGDVAAELDDALYYVPTRAAMGRAESMDMLANDMLQRLKKAKDALPIDAIADRKIINRMMGEIQQSLAPLKNVRKPKYNNDAQTLPGGKNYREVVFYVDEPIKTNRSALSKQSSHYSEMPNEVFHVRFDTRFTPDGKKVLTIHQIQADNQARMTKALTRDQQLDGVNRMNPFQKDIEDRLFLRAQSKLQDDLNIAASRGDASSIYKAADDLSANTKKISEVTARGKYDYFPHPDSSDYNDHAIKYLLGLAAREGASYVAVLPFDMLNYKASSKNQGNERAYGYSSGKGIGRKGKGVIPELMKKSARFFNTKAGPIKLARSDPKKPYKLIETEDYTYQFGPLKDKKLKINYHKDAVDFPKKGYKLITEDNPNLYFDAFAVEVNQLMRYTQKTYKSEGGLVVDMYKTIRYN